ncbi:MAG: 4Fe-4S binding protein [Eubacteriales bacterium]|nr:4Fe-4S binding protein [Eubacteriales bacterium]MDD3503164.1 4Fe-4S binding protein [Eubacteriales bacterium]
MLQKLKRKLVQTGAMIAGNGYLVGFLKGKIYQGPTKNVCLPGLNCYSCPGALGACPLGSLQSSIADPYQRISFYVLGFLILLGGIFGRFICGWLCPFGLIQEWLHKLPGRKFKVEKYKKVHAVLRRMPLVFLGVFVILLPFLGSVGGGYGSPWFCKAVCPSGTLMAGWPLLAVNVDLRALAGWLFGWKSLVLIIIIAASIVTMRPFCRYVCPLGAIYGFFNKISLYRVQVEQDKCISCGRCTRQCPMAVPVPFSANGSDCIRCGECATVCPTGAIHVGFDRKISIKKSEKINSNEIS